MANTIDFKGINWAQDDQLVPDGAATELVGMRVKNGSLQPMSDPYVTALPHGACKCWVHKVQGCVNWLYLSEQGAKWVLYSGKEYALESGGFAVGDSAKILESSDEIKDVVLIGMLFCVVYDDRVAYIHYRDGAYVYLGEGLSQPSVTFSQLEDEVFESDSHVFKMMETEPSTVVRDSWRRADADEGIAGGVPNLWALNDSEVGVGSKICEFHVNETKRFKEDLQQAAAATKGHAEFQGKVVGGITLFGAYRLFDGSYISPSTMIMLEGQEQVAVEITAVNWDNGREDALNELSYKLKMKAFGVSYEVGGFGRELLEAWGPLIQSYDVFASLSDLQELVFDGRVQYTIVDNPDHSYIHYGRDGEELYGQLYEGHQFWAGDYALEVASATHNKGCALWRLPCLAQYPIDYGSEYGDGWRFHRDDFCKKSDFPQLEHIKESVESSLSAFYRVKSFGIDELKAVGEFSDTFTSEDLSNRAVEVSWKAIRNSADRIVPSVNEVINGRWNQGDIKSYYYSGIDPSSLLSSSRSESSGIVYGHIEWALGVGGSQYLVYDVFGREGGSTHYDEFLKTSILAYPDIRANVVTIRYCHEDDEGRRSYKEWRQGLSPHPLQGFAYYSLRDKIDISRGCNGMTAEQFDLRHDAATHYTPGAVHEPNILRVSELYNPFVVSPSSSYAVGTGNIIDIAQQSVALSEGQFGQHPVLVFTSEGMYTLGIGSDGMYTQVSPVSRDVMLQGGHSLSIDRDVVYLSDRGLMSFNGGNVQNLSVSLDGDRSSYFPITGSVSKILGWDVTEDFREYCQGAVLGYHYAESEIYVSNAAKGYSYVYNLSSGQWSMVGYALSWVSNEYPGMVGIDGSNSGRLLSLGSNRHQEPNGLMAYVSRPMKLGSLGYKKLSKAILHGYIERRCSDSVDVAVYGSVDGRNYRMIASMGASSKEAYRDLQSALMRAGSMVYFVVVIIGDMRLGSRLNGVELL